MPRVNLGKDPIALQRERLADTTAKIIRKAMIDRNMRYGKDVADLVKMNRNTFAYKMRAGSWSQMDLMLLVAALKIPADDALQLLGVRK